MTCKISSELKMSTLRPLYNLIWNRPTMVLGDFILQQLPGVNTTGCAVALQTPDASLAERLNAGPMTLLVPIFSLFRLFFIFVDATSYCFDLSTPAIVRVIRFLTSPDHMLRFTLRLTTDDVASHTTQSNVVWVSRDVWEWRSDALLHDTINWPR